MIMWTQGLPEKEAEELKAILKLEANSKVWKRLLKIVQTKAERLEASERSPSVYDNPNWAYMQAHNNGARQTLSFIEKLLKGLE